jgi:tetratricopeptide (TPR) repeat protein
VRLAQAVDHPFSLVGAYDSLGTPQISKGDFEKGIPILERCAELCQVWRIPLQVPFILPHLGYAYAHSGRVEQSLPLLEHTVELAASMRFAVLQSFGVRFLGEAYMLAGREQDARDAADRALALSRQHKERGFEAWALRLLGEMAGQADPPKVEQAESYYRQALALAEELGMRPLAAHCHLGLGTLYQKIGRQEQAWGELTTAVELYRAMEMTFWLAKAEMALGQLAG